MLCLGIRLTGSKNLHHLTAVLVALRQQCNWIDQTGRNTQAICRRPSPVLLRTLEQVRSFRRYAGPTSRNNLRRWDALKTFRNLSLKRRYNEDGEKVADEL
jgi:hypothetical protein